MYDKTLSLNVAVACEEFQENFNWSLKYAIAGSYRQDLYPEHSPANDYVELDTREIFGELPDREDHTSIIFLIKNYSAIRMAVQMKRPNDTGTLASIGKIWPYEVFRAEPGRIDATGFTLRINLDPHDKTYAELTDEEKTEARCLAVGFAVDYTTGIRS